MEQISPHRRALTATRQFTPQRRAATRPLCNSCLGHKAPIDAKDKLGLTPLHVASQRGKEEVVDLLLRSGADANVGPAGVTPLHLAAGGGRVKAAELLLAKGARPDAKDLAGSTPLTQAAL